MITSAKLFRGEGVWEVTWIINDGDVGRKTQNPFPKLSRMYINWGPEFIYLLKIMTHIYSQNSHVLQLYKCILLSETYNTNLCLCCYCTIRHDRKKFNEKYRQNLQVVEICGQKYVTCNLHNAKTWHEICSNAQN